jgi:hypothetical protein
MKSNTGFDLGGGGVGRPKYVGKGIWLEEALTFWISNHLFGLELHMNIANLQPEKMVRVLWLRG